MRGSDLAPRFAGVSVCLASALALASPPASATTTALVCTETQTGVVSCLLPSGLSSYNTTTLLSLAQTVTSTPLTTSTPMVVTAFGGAGRSGDKGGGGYNGGSPGKGGTAQTITTVSDYQSSFGTTLYYYLGNEGGTSSAGRGGASTPVSGVDLTTQDPCISGYASCTTTTLLVDAGGGGGRGGGEAVTGGGGGGGSFAAPNTVDVTIPEISNPNATGGGSVYMTFVVS